MTRITQAESPRNARVLLIDPGAGPPGCRRRSLIVGGMCAALAPLAGCGGGEAALFVPFFSFIWDGTLEDRPVTVFFLPEDPDSCSAQGRFAVTSNINTTDADGANVSSQFSGRYDQRELRIELATPADPLARVYIGRFTADDTVRFTEEGGTQTFSVQRQNNGPDTRSCPG